jgi:hypothetical protein
MTTETEAPRRSPYKAAVSRVRPDPTIVGGTILIAALLFTFVLTPFTGDIVVFFAAAAQAEYHGPFPENVYRAWEFKPIGNRMLYYGLYKLVSQLAPFRDKSLFEPAVSLCLALVSLLVALVSTRSIHRILAAQGAQVSATMIFFVLSGLMLSASYNTSLQIEWVSTLLVLVAIPLAASERSAPNWFAGLLLALLFPLKGITVLMAGYVFIVLFSLGKPYRRRLGYVVAGTCIGVVVIAAGIAIFFPDEITDLRFVAEMQGSFDVGALPEGSKRMALYGFLRDTLRLPELLARVPVVATGEVLDRTRVLFAGLVLNAIHNNPFLAAGVFSLAMLTTLGAWRRTATMVAPSLAMWVIGLAIVGVQAQYSAYHYFVLAFPAAWSFLSFVGRGDEILLSAHDARARRVAFMLVFVLMAGVIGYPLRSAGVAFVVLWTMCIFTFALALLLAYEPVGRSSPIAGGGALVLSLLIWTFFVSPVSDQYRTWREFRATEYRLFSELDKKYSLSTQSSLVFLDDGRAAYYLPARSYERYFYGLPLVRGHSHVAVRTSPIYRGILSRLLSYRGTYILIYADYLELDSFQEIRSKIQREYTLVDTRVWVQQQNYPLSNPWTRREVLLLYRRSAI